MITSQTRHHVDGLDKLVREDDPDFATSRLRAPGLIRVGCLAVIEGDILVGAAGEVGHDGLHRIKQR